MGPDGMAVRPLAAVGGELSRLAGGPEQTGSMALERVPIAWTHVIDKDALRFEDLEHVLIEKVGQVFRDMP
jgi:hypothetical protein